MENNGKIIVEKRQLIEVEICELNEGAITLKRLIEVYQSILYGNIALSADTKKAVQSSIIDLCTSIIEIVNSE